MPRCHSFDSGIPCSRPARPGSSHCPAHDPAPGHDTRVPLQRFSPTSVANAPEPFSNAAEPIALSVQRAEKNNAPPPVEDPGASAPPSSPLPPPTACDTPETWPCFGQPGCCACQARPLRCHAISRRTGEICLFPARTEHAFCINHDPEYQAIQRHNARTAGHASARARSPIDIESLCLWIGDRAGIQAALDTVIRLELLGRISPARSRNVLRALAIAARNFDDPRRPTQPFDTSDYGSYRENIDDGLTHALEEAALRDSRPISRADAAKLRAADRLWERLGELLPGA